MAASSACTSLQGGWSEEEEEDGDLFIAVVTGSISLFLSSSSSFTDGSPMADGTSRRGSSPHNHLNKKKKEKAMRVVLQYVHTI